MTIANSMSAYWMPFTANRAFKADPRLIVGAKGMHYQTSDGRQVLDGAAGLWCCHVGHSHPKLVEAIQRQAAELDYSPAFQMGHPKAFELAQRIVDLAPVGFARTFYTNSGSEAVDTALKIAINYHRANGQATRYRLIGRERGYHGVGFGGVAVGGMVANRKAFGPTLAGVDHLRHTHDLARNRYRKGEPAHGAELADDLERLVGLHDASTIAAVIVEPVACSTGVLIPPVGYLQKLREICDRYGILLIFDEVITGFGRTGAAFGAQRFDVVPDMITFAKGVTSGAVPMGGVITRQGIYDTIVDDAPSGVELFHGYTYSSHPLACAAGLATLDIYRDEGLFERVAALAPYWEQAVHSLHGANHVIDLRNLGLIGAVELESRPGKPGARGYEVFRACFDAGLLVRASGDNIALSPPFVIEKGQVDQIIDTLRRVLTATD